MCMYVCTGLQLIQYAIRFTALTVQIYSSYGTGLQFRQYSTNNVYSSADILIPNFANQLLIIIKFTWDKLICFEYFFLFICDVIYTSIQQGLVVIEALLNFAKINSGMGIKVGVQYAVINYFFLNFHPMSLSSFYTVCKWQQFRRTYQGTWTGTWLLKG